MSTKISLNSFIKGGRTNTINIKKIIVSKNQTIERDNGLDIFSNNFSLLHKLHIIFATKMEHIISKKKFLKLQKIKKLKTNIDNL